MGKIHRLVIPERVRVNGEWWVVRREVNLDGEVVVGHPNRRKKIWDAITRYDRKEIELSRRIFGLKAERVAFLHELMHAATDKKVVTAADEERLLEAIDANLLDALESLEWDGPARRKK